MILSKRISSSIKHFFEAGKFCFFSSFVRANFFRSHIRLKTLLSANVVVVVVVVAAAAAIYRRLLTSKQL